MKQLVWMGHTNILHRRPQEPTLHLMSQFTWALISPCCQHSSKRCSAMQIWFTIAKLSPTTGHPVHVSITLTINTTEHTNT